MYEKTRKYDLQNYYTLVCRNYFGQCFVTSFCWYSPVALSKARCLLVLSQEITYFSILHTATGGTLMQWKSWASRPDPQRVFSYVTEGVRRRVRRLNPQLLRQLKRRLSLSLPTVSVSPCLQFFCVPFNLLSVEFLILRNV